MAALLNDLDPDSLLVLYVAGDFTGNNNQPPPFGPDFVPPTSAFASPASELDILVTPFMLRSGIWGLAENGKFNVVITPNEVPPTSPVQLNTNSPAFLAAAPGLSAYPNMNITVTLYLYNTSSVDISATGVYVTSTANASFALSNSTYAHPGWDCLVDIGFDATLTTSMSGNSIVVTPAIGNYAPYVYVINSEVGPVNPTMLTTLLKLVLSVAPQPKPESFAGPKDFAISNIVFNPLAGYGDASADIAYTPDIPGVVCVAGGLICPEQNTCCNWGGQWGCCTLPQAACCDSGCCFNGCSCVSGGCEC